MARVRLGDLLVEAQMITREQLDEVLAQQRTDRRRLGTLLVESGLVTETQVTQILSQQLAVPWVSLYHIDFSRQLLNLVPRDAAERDCLVPIFVRRVRGLGETLYVAMDDPTDEAAIERVSDFAGLPVRAMIAPPSDIQAAIRVYYGGGELDAEPRALADVAPPKPRTRAAPEAASPAAPAARTASATAEGRSDAVTTEAAAQAEAPGPPAAESAPARETRDDAAMAPADTTGAPEEAARAPQPSVYDIDVEVDLHHGDGAEPAGTATPAAHDEAGAEVDATDHVSAEAEAKSAALDAAAERLALDAAASLAAEADGSEPATVNIAEAGATRGRVHPGLSAAVAAALGVTPPPPPPASQPGASAGPLSGPADADDEPPRSITPSPDSTRLPAREPNMPQPRAGGGTGRMVSLTLLDGTTINLPSRGGQSAGAQHRTLARTSVASSGSEDELTARDLVAALRAVSHGADATEILGENARWEAMFAALLSVLLKKHLIADWEFVEEYRKI